MSAGEPVTQSRLLDTAVTGSLARGQVAATVALLDPRQSTFINAGATVDLYPAGTAQPLMGGPTSTSGGASVAAVATHVRVIAVLAGQQPATTEVTSLVIAVDTPTAARLATLGNTAYLATLRPPS
jgi:hypothetical protein